VLVSKVDTSTIVLTVAWVSAHGLPSRSDTSAPVPHVSSEVATSRAVHEPAESTSASTLSASDRLEWSLPAVAVGRETKGRRVASVREGLVGPDSVLEDSGRFRDLFRLASYSLDADALASAEEEPAGASWVLPRVAASVHVVAVLVLVAQSTAAVGVEAVSTEAPSCPVVTPSLHGCVTLVEGQPSSGPVLARVPVASVGSVMLVSKVETATIVATVARVSAHGLESRSKTSAVAPNVVAESATGSSVRDSAESTSLSALPTAGWLEWSLPAVPVGRGTRGHRVGCDWPAPIVGCTVESDLSSEVRWGASASASSSNSEDALSCAEEEPARASWVLPRVAASVHVVAVLVLVAQSTAAVGVETVSTEAPSVPVVAPSLHGRELVARPAVPGQPSLGPVVPRVPVASVGTMVLVSKVDTSTVVPAVARVSAHGLESTSKTTAVAPHVVSEGATGSSVRDTAESTSASTLSASGWLECSLPAVAVPRETCAQRECCNWPGPVVRHAVKSGLPAESLRDCWGVARPRDVALSCTEEEPVGGSWVLPRVGASVHVVGVLVLIAQRSSAVGVETVSTEAPALPVVGPSLHGRVVLVPG
jgi:hypothetical protein